MKTGTSYPYDNIGWSEYAVLSYRSVDAAPCRFENIQTMQINQTGGTWITYQTNRLKAGFDPSSAPTVWSYRNSLAEDPSVPVPSKNWP
jgi:hypothetical protein